MLYSVVWLFIPLGLSLLFTILSLLRHFFISHRAPFHPGPSLAMDLILFLFFTAGLVFAWANAASFMYTYTHGEYRYPYGTGEVYTTHPVSSAQANFARSSVAACIFATLSWAGHGVAWVWGVRDVRRWRREELERATREGRLEGIKEIRNIRMDMEREEKRASMRRENGVVDVGRR
jgi:hypothetical protein